MTVSESIYIKGLEVAAHIGVPDEERRESQRLKLDVRFQVATAFRDMGDDIAATTDYAEVAAAIERLVQERPRHLIETLADEVRVMVAEVFHSTSVWVRVRKKILPNAEWVSVETGDVLDTRGR
jgi:dihydroneopterin aldolase